MTECEEKVIKWLFATGAIEICGDERPFWYTSGKIGPYYINTHFLYGSRSKAEEMLDYIEDLKNNKLECTMKIAERVRSNYLDNPIYCGLVDCLLERINNCIPLEEADFISGGERRDWFFSIICAHLLKKPHITLFKDGDCTVYENGRTQFVSNLEKRSILHIADIINIASSYTEKWLPAVHEKNGKIRWSMSVIDRMQGGSQNLQNAGVKSFSLASVDEHMAEKAYKNSLISSKQRALLLEYIKDPDKTMSEFVKSHPEFIEQALNAGGKTASRARKCIETGYYAYRGE